MTTLSNRLTDLAERVKEATAASAAAERTGIEQALEAGRLLVDAKAAVQHGEWLPFLERTGLHERQARRLMQLARSGLQIGHVSDLGGIGSTLRWLSDVSLPASGQVFMTSLDSFSSKGDAPLALIWNEPDGYRLAMIDLNEGSPHSIVTKLPTRTEAEAFATLWHVLDYRFTEMSFQKAEGEFAKTVLRKMVLENPALADAVKDYAERYAA